MTLQGSWVWYELMTPDPDAAKAFYEAVAGWAMTTGHGDDTDYGFITAPDGATVGGVLRLSDEMQQHGARPGWLGYVGVDDADASAKAIADAGGRILMAPWDIAMAGRVAMAADPSGAPFYIMKPTPPPGDPEALSTAFSALPNPGHFGWNELYSADQPGAEAFYTGQFGWTLPEPMDMGPMGKYQFVAHGGVTTGAIMTKPEAVPVSAWGHYIWVTSIAAAKERVAGSGGQVINGPHQVPGELWVIQGIDPQGAMFSLVGGA